MKFLIISLLLVSSLAAADSYSTQQKYEYYVARGYKPSYAKEFAASDMSPREHEYYRARGVPTSTIQALGKTNMSAIDFHNLAARGVSGATIIEMAQAGVSYDDFEYYRGKGLSGQRIIELGRARIPRSTYDGYIQAKVPVSLMGQMANARTSVEDFQACLKKGYSKAVCAKLGSYAVKESVTLETRGCTKNNLACAGKRYVDFSSGSIVTVEAIDFERGQFYGGFLDQNDGSVDIRVKRTDQDEEQFRLIDSKVCSLEEKDGYIHAAVADFVLRSRTTSPLDAGNQLSNLKNAGICRENDLSKERCSLDVKDGRAYLKVGEKTFRSGYSSPKDLAEALISLKNAGLCSNNELSSQKSTIVNRDGWIHVQVGETFLGSGYSSPKSVGEELTALKEAGVRIDPELAREKCSVEERDGWVYVKVGATTFRSGHSSPKAVAEELVALKAAGLCGKSDVAGERATIEQKEGWVSVKLGATKFKSGHSSPKAVAEELSALKDAGARIDPKLAQEKCTLVQKDRWASIQVGEIVFSAGHTSAKSIAEEMISLRSAGLSSGTSLLREKCAIENKEGWNYIKVGQVSFGGISDASLANEISVVKRSGLCDNHSL